MNQPLPKPPNGSKLPALNEETWRMLLAQQAQEANLRTQELQIRRQELDYQSKHALEIVGAQERDREKERLHLRTIERNKMIFGGVVLVVVVLFCCLGFYMNKDSIVRDTMQTLLGAVLGGVGGYGYATSQRKRETRSDEE